MLFLWYVTIQISFQKDLIKHVVVNIALFKRAKGMK